MVSYLTLLLDQHVPSFKKPYLTLLLDQLTLHVVRAFGADYAFCKEGHLWYMVDSYLAIPSPIFSPPPFPQVTEGLAGSNSGPTVHNYMPVQSPAKLL